MNKIHYPQTIGVALSGGVDSTVTAGLLLEQGYSVEGFFMILPLSGVEEQIHKVEAVARQLQIPLHRIDLAENFTRDIIDTFMLAYQQGLTPNPCVLCNKMIKCGRLLDEVQRYGISVMATGHYARIEKDNGTPTLKRAGDPSKDQSYFLCRLQQNQLSHLMTPLGNKTKSTVYQIAEVMGFSFGKEESQDVCFLSEQRLADFLSSRGIRDSPGEIITLDGTVLGAHQGIWKYTVGQRRGLGIPDATPWYVTGLDAAANRVIIGKNENLFQHTVLLKGVIWSIPKPREWQGKVQLRSRHRAAEAQVHRFTDHLWQVTFKEPQRAVSPGQYAVFYDLDRVVGSGIINQSTPFS